MTFRDKYTPFLTCLVIVFLLPVAYYLEKMVVPKKGIGHLVAPMLQRQMVSVWLAYGWRMG